MRADRPKALLSWSSGKDSAWALHVLRAAGDVEVCGLLTTLSERADRVAMHAVRRELVEAQARAAGLPLHFVPLPWPCPNAVYEQRMTEALERARGDGVRRLAFGDLYLADIRAYRERLLAGSGIEPLFPIFCSAADTPALAQRMLDAGLGAILTCVDPEQLDARFAGRRFDRALLDELPAGVDPLGENGEFHTFCTAGPAFAGPVDVTPGEVVRRDGLVFVDLRPAGS